MTELWRDSGDVIYEVPRRSRSLAHVMLAGDLVQLPPAEFHWRAPSAASVTADLRPGQILSVQMSWDKGWNASVDGRPVPIRGDKLGQVVVEPRCSGPCTVELNYDGGAEGRWA